MTAGESLAAFRWIVEGRVQGVSYRAFTRQAALRAGLDGWARNLPDGTVEVLAVGLPAALSELEARLREGPRWGRVDRLTREVVDPAAADYRQGEFEIRV